MRVACYGARLLVHLLVAFLSNLIRRLMTMATTLDDEVYAQIKVLQCNCDVKHFTVVCVNDDVMAH